MKNLSFLFIFFPLIVIAQKNYKEGFIINSNGEKVAGHIDYKNWNKAPLSIAFKENDKGEMVLTPDKINSFYVNLGDREEIYESLMVSYDSTSDKFGEMDYSAAAKNKTERVFLYLLVQGEASLYSYVDVNGREHFFLKDKLGIEELLFRKYYVINEGIKTVAKNERYKRQLMKLAVLCSSLEKDINLTRYSSKSLIALINKYNLCVNSGASANYTVKKESSKMQIGLLTGITQTKVRFEGNEFQHSKKLNLSPSNNFTAGIFVNNFLPRSNNHWAIYNDLHYKSYFMQDHYLGSPEVRASFEFDYLKLNTSLRYYFTNNNYCPFISFGFSNAYMISSEYVGYFKYVQETPLPEFAEIKKYEFGIIGGMGISIKKLDLIIRYEKSNGFSPYFNLLSDISTIYFTIGYSFK